MPKLDHNLDAYRLAAAALGRLRALLRRHLEATHGTGWEKDGLPAETREFLAQRREREAAVKWNPATGLDVLDFAGFVNLYEVLTSLPRLRDGFSRLVPEPQALRMRFLELDTVLNRIAYARPVSESDMELLLGFDERLRALATDLPIDTLAETTAPEEPAPVARLSQPAPAANEPLKPAATQTPAPAAPPAAPATVAPASPPSSSGKPRASEGRPGRGHGGSQGPPTTGSIPVILNKEAQGSAPVKDLDAALRRGDDPAVLTALYQEITGLAEKIWGDAASARSPIWEAVRESAWYENRFSALRLRVVSDFYDLLRNVQERQAAGNTRTDVHEFLKERNFAQILMDLREFFRPLAASSRQGRG